MSEEINDIFNEPTTPEFVALSQEEDRTSKKRRGRPVGWRKPPSNLDPSADITVFQTAGASIDGDLTAAREALTRAASSMKDVFKAAGKVVKDLEKATNADAKSLQKELTEANKAIEKLETKLTRLTIESNGKLDSAVDRAIADTMKEDKRVVLAVLRREMDAIKDDEDIERPWKRYILELYKHTVDEIKAL